LREALLVNAGAFNSSATFNIGMRSSVDENAYLEGVFGAISPEFLQSIIPQLKRLVLHHQDFSMAMKNLMNLGNTRQTVTFDSNVSPRLALKMRNHLLKREASWYPNSSATTFVNALFLQAATFGAISAEVVPNLALTGVQYLTTVDAENIVFFMEGGIARPYQVLRSTTYRNTSGTPYLPLNTAQYCYRPIIKGFSTPYGIPLFLSALFAEGIQRDMSANFMNIARRLGAFGFLNVLLEAPAREKDAQGNYSEPVKDYQMRVQQYIDEQAIRIKGGFNNGFVVGVKGKHEFQIDGNGTNASNASDMFSLVDTMLAAGVGQDPALLGRNRTVTETFGRVVLQVLTTQVQTIQMIIAEFLDFARLKELQLAGFKVSKVTTTFASPLPGDELKDQQTRQLKITNGKELLALGIISPEQFAQELGYESPYNPEGASPAPANGGKKTVPPAADGRTNPSAGGKSFAQLFSMPDAYPAYGATIWGDKTMQNFADGYLDETNKAYKKFAKKLGTTIGKAIEEQADAELEEWLSIAAAELEKATANFTQDFPKTAQKHIEPIYKHYRGDASLFPKTETAQNSFAFVPPTPVLNLADLRAIEWLKARDTFFISKFITDPDIIAEVLEFIRKFHLENGEAIGDNKKVLAEFINQFADLFDGHIWKIRRVLDTSVNSIRSYANVAYMKQAAVAEFKVLEIMDGITCAHCRNMNGRVFSVTTEATKIETITQSKDFENIDTLAPFATSIPIADLTAMTNEQIQAKGIGATPFHPSCRGTLVAVL